jgi:hypothetical protein
VALSHDLSQAALSHDLSQVALSHDLSQVALSHDLSQAALSHDLSQAFLHSWLAADSVFALLHVVSLALLLQHDVMVSATTAIIVNNTFFIFVSF